jgi:molybdopterin synthase catalytic subunit
MKLRVRLWGGLAEAGGFHDEMIDIDLPLATAADVVRLLEERAPRLARFHAVTRIAVNADIVDPTAPVADGDEISLLPPVAGGQAPDPRADLIAIREGPLDAAEATAFVTTPASGGIGIFVGVVRETNDGNAVSEIDYTAFEELAIPVMREIAAEARARWPLHRVAVLHSIGRLRVGDASVVVATSAEHRAEALEACRYVIDAVKERAPVWKQEFGPDGTRWINLPAGPGPAAGAIPPPGR